jgi:hypothetical protein
MRALNTDQLECYLKSLVGSSVRITRVKVLGEEGKEDIKAYGYGTPVLIDYVSNGKPQRAVLHTISPGPFGHEHMSDRAQILLWEHSAFNLLPRHIRSMDVGAFRGDDGGAVSLGNAEEFFILTEYAEGRGYFEDLTKMRDNPALSDIDISRADALCDYLVEMHSIEGSNPELYTRRIRELVGHSECIMGLIDSYPAGGDVHPMLLSEIEHESVNWRWRLKNRTHRLRQVHGDFHPWNILFRENTDFTLLDRSRGEWGEPADDVTSLTMNFLFFSLQRSGRLDGNFETLFKRFWERYLTKSGDVEMLQVTAPFFAFRGLVMAHPVWYPNLSKEVRQTLFNFIRAVMSQEFFSPDEVNHYCEA